MSGKFYMVKRGRLSLQIVLDIETKNVYPVRASTLNKPKIVKIGESSKDFTHTEQSSANTKEKEPEEQVKAEGPFAWKVVK